MSIATPHGHRWSARALAPTILAASLYGCSAPTPRTAEAEPAATGPFVSAADEVEAGRYLTSIGGCNDCHTPRYMETDGAIPEEDRLVGSDLGWRGPWGTSYPANLRLTAQGMDADQWIAMIRGRTTMPPMPWPSVHAMSDRDLGAIHVYLRHLGPKGQAAPAYVPPDREPSTPFLNLIPVTSTGGR